MNNFREQQFYDLLSLKLSGDATAKDLALLQAQLLLHPEWQFLYNEMLQPLDVDNAMASQAAQAYAAHFVKMQIAGKFDTDTDCQLTDNDQKIKTIPITKYQWYKRIGVTIVAASIVMIALNVYFNKAIQSSKKLSSSRANNEIVTGKNSKSNIKLPDGTSVWLNANSQLSYSENFRTSSREVILSGEAYFDVVHDSLHPFVIHSGKVNIKVLGTAFNIRNYPDEKSLQATLIRGKIEVTVDDRAGEKIILRPLEKLTVLKQNSTLNDNAAHENLDKAQMILSEETQVAVATVSYSGKDSLVEETSWVNDKMVFTNELFENIVKELEKKYKVVFEYKNLAVKKYRYTGVFDDEPIDKILNLMQLSRKFNYKIDKTRITIY